MDRDVDCASNTVQLREQFGGSISMKTIAMRVLVFGPLAFLLVVAVCTLLPSSAVTLDQKVQTIELTAKKYEYIGSPVHVKAGTRVQLKITAADHDHGFKISVVPDGAEASGTVGLVLTSPQECWQLKKSETTTIEFLAQSPGTYTFRCCHTCGLGHKGMKGQIVVD
jgi:heme/copper-type cytochrome/quinol oxidase subunit 2